MRSVIAGFALLFLISCGAYPLSESEKNRVSIDGVGFIVQKDPYQDDYWGSAFDGLFAGTLDVVGRRNGHISAIEVVSGCEVQRDSIVENSPGGVISILAKVSC